MSKQILQEPQKVFLPNKYQQEALKILAKTKEKGGVIVLPTGTGKTFMSALWVKSLLKRNPKASFLYICHNNDILLQANEKEFQSCLKDFNICYGYYNGNKKQIEQCTFGTIQSLSRSLENFDKKEFDYIIVDEAHHYQASTYREVLKYFEPKFMLGMTGTPYRMDNKSIFKIIGKKLYEVKTHEAIESNLLTNLSYWCVDNDIDFSKIKYNGSSYSEKDLNKKICIKKYDEAILQEYEDIIKKKFKKKKTICFSATVEHAHRLANYFNSQGIKSVALTGRNLLSVDKISRGKRKKIIKGFKENEYEIIFVRDLFNEGIDVPSCDSIIMLRPTSSHIIFTQQVGRGLRKSKNKEDLLVLDFTGNARRCNINFEVLGDVIGHDIVTDIKYRNLNQSELNQLIELNPRFKIRLTRTKFDVIKQMKKRPTKQQLIQEYKELKEKLGRVPKARESNNCAFFHRLYWNSWEQFLESMGETPYCRRRDVTEEELITEYYKMKKKLGKRPLQKHFSSNKKYGAKFNLKKYEKHFGKWSDFLKHIGEPISANNMNRKRVSKQELIDNYYQMKKVLGRKPLSSDMKLKKGSKYGMSIYEAYFGTWNKFLKSLGEKARELNIPKEKLIKELKAKAKELGRIPKTTEFGNSYPVLIKHYDNKWKNAIKDIFGEDCDYEFKGSRTVKSKCKNCGKKMKYFKSRTENGIQDFCSTKCYAIHRNETTIGDKHKDVIKWYNMGATQKQIADKFNVSPNTIRLYLIRNNVKFRPKGYRSNFKFNDKVKSEDVAVKRGEKRTNKGTLKLKDKGFKVKEDKNEIRNNILSLIKNNQNVLLLESPSLECIKRLEKRKVRPNKIVIPNNQEYKKLKEALIKLDSDLEIELHNCSVYTYLKKNPSEKFDFIWLDYCGAFSYYQKDLDLVLNQNNPKLNLVTTYNIFDMAKDDDNYYFTNVISYILDKNNQRYDVRLIPKITNKYKKNMYNLGFKLTKLKKNGKS